MKETLELKGRIYKCENCGSFLRYDPVSKKLKCTHCSTLVDLIQVPNARELVYTNMSETHYEPWGETKSVKCRSCGAVTVLNEFETTSNCPFCSASNITSIDDIPGLKPNAVLPFSISQEKAQEIYANWVSHKKFSPISLKKLAEKRDIKGVYAPIFTFDTATFSRYKIRYGEYYFVTVGVGKNKHTERRIRWYEDSGSFNMDFNDIQVEASKYLTSKDMSKLGGFDTDNSLRYHSQFLSGYCSERYSESLDKSWDSAKDYASSIIRRNILKKYNYDELDYCNVSTSFNNNTFKYCLVPIWIILYRFKGKDYKCIINGRNGKIAGKAPISTAKVSSLVGIGLILLGFVVYLIYKFYTGA